MNGNILSTTPNINPRSFERAFGSSSSSRKRFPSLYYLHFDDLRACEKSVVWKKIVDININYFIFEVSLYLACEIEIELNKRVNAKDAEKFIVLLGSECILYCLLLFFEKGNCYFQGARYLSQKILTMEQDTFYIFTLVIRHNHKTEHKHRTHRKDLKYDSWSKAMNKKCIIIYRYGAQRKRKNTQWSKTQKKWTIPSSKLVCESLSYLK